MSAAIPEPHDYDSGFSDGHDEAVLAAEPVVVRRNAGLAALIGAGASAIAIAYLWRATQSGAGIDWALCGVMSLIAGFYLAGLVDARTPLVVADDLGVRIRLGQQWRGLPWEAVGRIVVQPRRGALRDGRLTFTPHSLGRALDGLDTRGRRQAALNQKLYGAALAVPLGLTTRVSRPEHDVPLEDRIGALARGRTDVVVVLPEPAPAAEPGTPEPVRPAEPMTFEPVTPEPAPRVVDRVPDVEETDVEETRPEEPEATPRPGPVERLRALAAWLASRPLARPAGEPRVAEEPEAAGEEPEVTEEEPEAAGTPTVSLREVRRGLRAEITRESPAGASGNPPSEGRELHRPGRVDLVFEAVDDSRVRPISRFGQAVEPLVIDDFVTEPAYDPVIGPELAAARTRLGISVDDLAERTRIRPHVIESIEVDDFGPCGGDFYARGHLRTLARVLGKDVTPLLEQFDNRYATAPINARRVFEAELATGMTGSMRSTIGGPNWGLLVGVVLALVLLWGVVRLFATEPPVVMQSPAPVLNGSAGIGSGFADSTPVGRPLHVTLSAPAAGARVVVRDGDGKVVLAALVRPGHPAKLAALPPVQVHADRPGVVRVRVDGTPDGTVGWTTLTLRR